MGALGQFGRLDWHSRAVVCSITNPRGSQRRINIREAPPRHAMRASRSHSRALTCIAGASSHAAMSDVGLEQRACLV